MLWQQTFSDPLCRAASCVNLICCTKGQGIFSGGGVARISGSRQPYLSVPSPFLHSTGCFFRVKTEASFSSSCLPLTQWPHPSCTIMYSGKFLLVMSLQDYLLCLFFWSFVELFSSLYAPCIPRILIRYSLPFSSHMFIFQHGTLVAFILHGPSISLILAYSVYCHGFVCFRCCCMACQCLASSSSFCGSSMRVLSISSFVLSLFVWVLLYRTSLIVFYSVLSSVAPFRLWIV